MSDPIIIVGAGVSGLALAQGLQKHHVPFRIFERDLELHARAQGYRVRISEEGISALEQNLPPARFDKLIRCCAEVTTKGNVPSAVLDVFTGGPAQSLFRPGSKPPVTAEGKPMVADRGVLREVLSQGLQPSIEFGKEFESYLKDDTGVTVTFKDGTTCHGSVLVAADGAWSKIRAQLLPEYRLVDTEARLIYGKTVLTEHLNTHFSSTALRGMTMIRGPGLHCLLEPMRFKQDENETPEDYIYWVLFLRQDKYMPDLELLHLTAEETAALAKQVTADWHESFHALFETTHLSVNRIVSSRPHKILTATPDDSRITFIGDSAHAMVSSCNIA